MIDPLIENKTLRILLTSRNKLVEQLLTELPLSETIYRQGVEMLDANWANDKAIWDTAYKEDYDRENSNS